MFIPPTVQLGAWTPGISKIRNETIPKCPAIYTYSEIAPGWESRKQYKEVSYCGEAYVQLPNFLIRIQYKSGKNNNAAP